MKLKTDKMYIDIENSVLITILAMGSSYKKEYMVAKVPRMNNATYWLKEKYITELNKEENPEYFL